MNQTEQQISEQVDSWIAEEDLPSRANVKPLKAQNPAYLGIADPITEEWLLEPMDEDEIEAYRDFMHWNMAKPYHMIMTLPQAKSDAWLPPIEEDGDLTLTFAFTSADYAGLHPDTFDRQAYRIKKIYERVKDLADTHSAVSEREGKENIHQRYVTLVEKEFRDEAVMLRTNYLKNPQWVDKNGCMARIKSINSHIRKCNEIWQKYATEGA